MMAHFLQNEEGISPGDRFMNGRYQVIQKLASGGQANVLLVKDTIEKIEKALKMVDNESLETMREIQLLKELKDKCPFIIQYYDDFSFYAIKRCIVTEYCRNGDVEELMSKFRTSNRTFSDQEINYWNMQMLEGISFLHQNDIIHRDIKPKNIFLTQSGKLKIGDLGYSKSVKNLTQSISKFVGSSNYLSPEIVNEDVRYDSKIDVWSYGCVLYEMITFGKLFSGANDQEIRHQILNKQIKLPETDQLFMKLLAGSLRRNRRERLTSAELLKICIDTKKTASANDKEKTEVKETHVKNEASAITAKKSTFTTEIRIQVEKKIPVKQQSAISVGYKCTKVFEGHTDFIKAVKFYNNSKIITFATDRIVKIWDIQTGECVRTISPSSQLVKVLPNGNIICLDGLTSKNIRILNVEDAKVDKTLRGHSHAVISIKHVDDERLISGGYDKTIIIWDYRQGTAAKTLHGHEDMICVLKYLNKSELIISGSADKTLRVWNASTGECLNKLEGHKSNVQRLKLIDDVRIVSASFIGDIRIWNVNTAECIHEFNDTYGSTLSCLKMLPTNRILVATSSRIKILDVENRKCLLSVRKMPKIDSVKLINNNLWCVCAGSKGITVCDLTSGGQIARFDEGESIHERKICVFSNNEIIASDDDVIKIWQLDNLEKN